MRIPAEWEPQEAVIMAWPHEYTDWDYILPEAQDCFVQIVSAIAKVAKVIVCSPHVEEVKERLPQENVIVCRVPTNDTWARDFGPISLMDDDGNISALDFVFNGWGLKFPAFLDNRITQCLFELKQLAPIRKLLSSNFVLEGGSIESDGEGAILTTSFCLLAPNRNYINQEETEAYLKRLLFANRVLWLKHGRLIGDDTDGHIDTIARFISPTAIAYASCDREEDQHYLELAQMEKELSRFTTEDGDPYLLIPLPIPNPIYDEEGQRLPATYANFLICNGSVFLPVYGDKHYDQLAIDTMQLAMPDYKIVPIDCRVLIEQHGSLHCMTMQIPKSLD